MLKVREEYKELAIYFTGRLFSEDALWRVLSRVGEAMTVRELSDETHRLTEQRVPLDRLEWVLRRCSDRFQPETDGHWGLTIWHIPRERTFVAKAEVILELSALPLTTRDLAGLLQRCHYPQHATPEIVGRVLQTAAKQNTFVKLGEYWFLARWVDWKYSKGEQSLLDQMMEPDTSAAFLRHSSPPYACVNLLRTVGVAVSTAYLTWALERGGMKLTPDLLCRDVRFVPVCRGHWFLEELAPMLVAQFIELGIEHLERMELQLEQLSHEADLKRLEQKLREEIQQFKDEALSALSDRLLSIEELCTRLGLNRWIDRATSNEAEQAKLVIIAQSELMRLEGDLVQLPSGRLLSLSRKQVERVVQYLSQNLCSLSSQEVLSGVLELTLEDNDKGAAVDALRKRLKQCKELELTEGEWHLASNLLRARLTSSTVNELRELLESSPSSIPINRLVQNIFGLPRSPQGTMSRILTELAEERLGNEIPLWRLRSSCWWLLPEQLATDARVRRLEELTREHPQVSLEELLLPACGLRLEGLDVEEKARLMGAFSRKLSEATKRELISAPPSAPVTPVDRGEIVPPKQTRFTLTSEDISEGKIPITPGLRQMLSLYRPSVTSELVTYGAWRLQVQIEKRQRCLVGQDIAKWYMENKLRPGDIIYICAPEQRGEPLCLFTVFEMRKKTEEERGDSLLKGRRRLYLREQIYRILEQNGRVMSISELCATIKTDLGQTVERASVQATLSRESHLFVAWGETYWGLREWGQDWRIRVDKQALLMRVLEEDLVVQILKDCRRWMTVHEIAQQLGQQFQLPTGFVIETSVLDPGDPRLARRRDLWGLLEWERLYSPPWFGPLLTDSKFKLLVNDWLQQRWGLKLEALIGNLDLAQKN